MSRLRRLLELLDPQGSRRLKLTVPFSVFLALLEALGLALLFPVISALASPALLEEDELMRRLYDLSGATTVNGFIATVGAAVLGLFVLRIVLQIGFARWQAGVLAMVEARLTAKLLTEYLQRDWSFHSARNSAELIYVVRNVAPNAVWSYLLPAAALVTDVVVIGAIAMTLFLVDPVGTIVSAIILTAASALYFFVSSRPNRRLSELRLGVENRAQRLIQEGLYGVKVLKVLGRSGRVSGAYEETRMDVASYQARLRFLGQLPRYFLEVALTIGLASIVAVTLIRDSGPDAVTSLGFLAVGGFRMLPSFQRVVSGLNMMQASGPWVDRLITECEALDRLPRDLGDAEVDGLEFTGEIRVDGLSFTYPGTDLAALDSVDLVIRRSEFIGLVGPSGSGKSTLADIMLGLLSPTSGSFSVDGIEVADERIAAWRRIVGYVPQETFIFDDTVRSNVVLGLEESEVDEVRLTQAVSAARLDDVVAGLPEGLSTVLGESGSRLSGGERQRVGLARALYDRPEVLILDEATSSLDGLTEAAIAATIDELSASITVIVIAHRLATVKRCDRIIHLGEGRVRSEGTFAELVEADPEFRAQATAGEVQWLTGQDTSR